MQAALLWWQSFSVWLTTHAIVVTSSQQQHTAIMSQE
jgi:hypothetical protein